MKTRGKRESASRKERSIPARESEDALGVVGEGADLGDARVGSAEFLEDGIGFGGEEAGERAEGCVR